MLDSCAVDKDAAKQAIANLAQNNETEDVEKKEKRKAKKKPAPKRRDRGSDSEGDFEMEKTPRKARGRKKVVDSDEDEPVLQTAVRNKRQPARKLASRNEAIEEDDEDEEMESPVQQPRRGRKNAANDSDEEIPTCKSVWNCLGIIVIIGFFLQLREKGKPLQRMEAGQQGRLSGFRF